MRSKGREIPQRRLKWPCSTCANHRRMLKAEGIVKQKDLPAFISFASKAEFDQHQARGVHRGYA